MKCGVEGNVPNNENKIQQNIQNKIKKMFVGPVYPIEI